MCKSQTFNITFLPLDPIMSKLYLKCYMWSSPFKDTGCYVDGAAY